MISGDMVAQAALILFRAAVCAFLAFGAGYWIITSWIDKRLSAVEAGGLLAALLVVMSLLVMYAVQSSLVMVFIVIALSVALVLALRGYAASADRRLNRRFDEEDIAKYLAALELDPNNVAAHSLLADVYRRQNRWEEALAEYEAAVKLSPELQKERYWIDRLKAMADRKSQGLAIYEKVKVREFVCPDCGAIIGPDEADCPECGKHVGKG